MSNGPNSDNEEYGEVQFGNNPNKPPLKWFKETRYGSNTRNTKYGVQYSIEAFTEWLKIESYNRDDELPDPATVDLDEIDLYELDNPLLPQDITIDDATDFLKFVQEKYPAGGTQRGRVQFIRKFYDFCQKRGHSQFEGVGNPIEMAQEENDILDEADGRNAHVIPVEEMADHIRSFDHPLWEAVTGLLAKHPPRKGAVINLDLMDIQLNHPACDWTVDKNLRHYSNAIFIPKKPEAGEEFRGEIRKESNKTSKDRILILDRELKDLFLAWLAIRPGELEPNSPFFTSLWQKYGERLPSSTLGTALQKQAKKNGHWYGPRDDDNINPHYFRHWTSSTLGARLGYANYQNSMLVKMLRGDSVATIDDYTHWSEDLRKQYFSIVPKFYE